MANLMHAARVAQIHDLIKSKMEEYGLDKFTLTEKMGGDYNATLNNVKFWLAGRGAPGAKYAHSLAEALQVDVKDLLLNPHDASREIVPFIPPPQEGAAKKNKKVTFTVEGDFDGEVTIIMKGKS